MQEARTYDHDVSPCLSHLASFLPLLPAPTAPAEDGNMYLWKDIEAKAAKLGVTVEQGLSLDGVSLLILRANLLNPKPTTLVNFLDFNPY